MAMIFSTVSEFQITVKETCSKILTFGSKDRKIGRAIDLDLLVWKIEVMRTGYDAVDCREMLHCLSHVET